MILIVGLGNFGMEYSGTVHNAGFMAVDRLCDNNGIEITKTDFKSKLCSCNLFGGILFHLWVQKIFQGSESELGQKDQFII